MSVRCEKSPALVANEEYSSTSLLDLDGIPSAPFTLDGCVRYWIARTEFRGGSNALETSLCKRPALTPTIQEPVSHTLHATSDWPQYLNLTLGLAYLFLYLSGSTRSHSVATGVQAPIKLILRLRICVDDKSLSLSPPPAQTLLETSPEASPGRTKSTGIFRRTHNDIFTLGYGVAPRAIQKMNS